MTGRVFGNVISVVERKEGDFLSQAASTSDTTLYLDDATPFDEDGGQARVNDPDEQISRSKPQFRSQNSSIPAHRQEGFEIQPKRNHRVALRPADPFSEKLASHRVAHGDNAVSKPGQHPLGRQNDPGLQRREIAVENVPMKRMDDHRHTRAARGDTPKEPGLGRVGMDDVRPDPSH